ncbi:MAG: polyhydroxybutyrate depolymerase [Pseudomonadota bacterium]
MKLTHMKPLIIAIAAVTMTAGATFITQQAHACGADTNCNILENRHYRIRMPEGHDGKTPVGAIIYAHGYKGSAAGAMRNKSMGKAVSDLGLALIAVKSGSDDWDIPNAPHEPAPERQKEMEYFDAVLADVGKQFPVDTSNIMMTGFSAGGQVTWTLACNRSTSFAGFAPMAGTFWEPTPKTCETPPAHVLHLHGTADRVVPLKGRPIRNTHQGNVFDVISMYTELGGYEEKSKANPLDLQCERSENKNGKVLEICLHGGGHQFKTQYIVRAWNELKALGAVR